MPSDSQKSEKEMRYSDKQLYELHSEFQKHVKSCEEQFQEGREIQAQIMASQLENTKAIATVVSEVSEIVQLHKDFQGAIRVGKGVQSFGVWILKWPLIGAGVFAVFSWIVKLLEKIDF